MAEIISGKTINQLVQIEDITGNEIIPLSMYNETSGRYVTRAITLSNMLKLLVNAINNTNERISYAETVLDNKIVTTASYLNTSLNEKIDEKTSKIVGDLSYVNSYIADLKQEDIKINEQLGYTVAYTSYNANAIVRLGGDIHNVSYKLDNTSSYVTEVISYNIDHITYNLTELTTYTSDLSSYTHTEFANNDSVNAYQNAYIAYNYGYDEIQQSEIDRNTYIINDPWTTIFETVE